MYLRMKGDIDAEAANGGIVHSKKMEAPELE
jgi:hypothetical protein